jgi:hypothetical protein
MNKLKTLLKKYPKLTGALGGSAITLATQYWGPLGGKVVEYIIASLFG